MNIKTKVICISGHAQHGKDTTAGILQDLLKDLGNRVLITHYADLLKFMCANLFGWNGKKDEEGRTILQKVGTDVIRKQEPDFWVDFIIRVLKLFPNEWDYVIIPDCRFPNEIAAFQREGIDYLHMRVRRAGFKSPLTEEQQKHPSETALNDVVPDIWIDNDGDLNDLREKLAGICFDLMSEEVAGCIIV